MKNFLTIIIFSLTVSISVFGQQKTDRSPDKTESLKTDLKPLDNGISFLVIGDFGRHGAYTQKEVAQVMGNVAEKLAANFTVSVGDNFYPSGVQSTQDYQWVSSYETIYTHHSLHEPWYVALGNHDYEGNFQAQIDYSTISRRWEMPARYFEKLIKIDSENYVQLLVIDTNPFVSKYKANPEKYLGINAQNTQDQIKWLEDKLSDKNPKIKWRLVVGHHPLYSGGKRIHEKETLEIKTIFEPIFKKYNVDAYFTRHEHDLQIIKTPDHSFTQFLSGTGSELRPTGETKGTMFAASVPGFMAFSLNRNSLNTYVIQAESNGYKIIYQTTIKK